MIKIKGHEIPKPSIKDSFGRRAQQMQGHIVDILRELGVNKEQINVSMVTFATQNLPASVSWYFEGRNFKYSYSLMPRFVENLYIIEKVLKLEVERLMSKEITLEEFAREFSEDDDIKDQLVEARKTLGVDENEKDFEVITKSYKKLARQHHPDMAEGNHEKFQEINLAHKLLQKELM